MSEIEPFYKQITCLSNSILKSVLVQSVELHTNDSITKY